MSEANAPPSLAIEPIPKLPHREDPRFSNQKLGEPVLGNVPGIYVFKDVLEELCYRGAYAPEDVSASLLTGGWYVGPDGPYVEVDGFRDTVQTDGPLQFLHFLRGNLNLLEPTEDELLIGTSQVRPGTGARMTPDDLLLHNTFFNLPFHLLVLIDPLDDAFAFYVRDSEGMLHNVPIVLLEARQAVESEDVELREDGEDERDPASTGPQPRTALAEEAASDDDSAPDEESESSGAVESNTQRKSEAGDDDDRDR